MDDNFSFLTQRCHELHAEIKASERQLSWKIVAFVGCAAAAILLAGPSVKVLALGALVFGALAVLNELSLLRLRTALDNAELQRSIHAK